MANGNKVNRCAFLIVTTLLPDSASSRLRTAGHSSGPFCLVTDGVGEMFCCGGGVGATLVRGLTKARPPNSNLNSPLPDFELKTKPPPMKL